MYPEKPVNKEIKMLFSFLQGFLLNIANNLSKLNKWLTFVPFFFFRTLQFLLSWCIYMLLSFSCGTLWVHSFPWVSTSQRTPLSALAQNPCQGLAREISYETRRRRGKARSLISQWHSRKGDGQRQQLLSWDLWTQKPGRRVRKNESAFLVAVWEFSSTCLRQTQNVGKVPKLLPSCIWS